MPVNCS